LAAGPSLDDAICRALEVNALAQGALRQVTHWPWIKPFDWEGFQSFIKVWLWWPL